MTRSRTALAIAAGFVAGVTVVAVAAAASNSGTSHRGQTAATATGDDLELQALSQVESGTASPSASADPSGPASHGFRGGFGGGLLGGAVLHGDVVVQGPDGKPVTVAIQRGTVTSVGDGKLTVHSSDGFEQSWTTGSTTRYVAPRLFLRGPGARAEASPTPSASPEAGVIKGVTVVVLGRTQGSGAPTARLVVNVPDAAGLGIGRLGPGMRPRWGAPMGDLHPGRPGPRWPGSLPSGSPSAAARAAA